MVEGKEKTVGKNTKFWLYLSCGICSITGITIHDTGKPATGAWFEMAVPKGAFRF